MYIQTKEPEAVSLWAFCILLFCCGQIGGFAAEDRKHQSARRSGNFGVLYNNDTMQIQLEKILIV